MVVVVEWRGESFPGTQYAQSSTDTNQLYQSTPADQMHPFMANMEKQEKTDH